MLRRLIGQAGESQVWQEEGLADDSPLLLTIIRKRIPGDGWEKLDIQGKVRFERAYLNELNQRSFGAGGPGTLSTDGFDGAWEFWVDQRKSSWSKALLYKQLSMNINLNTRVALQDHLEDEPRVTFLRQHYPGPFADAVSADWEAARDCLQGRRYELPPGALDFRSLQDEETNRITSIASSTWQGFLTAHASEIIPASLTIDPMHDDLHQIAGKLVKLPPISPDDWVADTGRAFLTSNQDDSWYFVDAGSEVMKRLFITAERYKRLVTPALGEGIALVGRIVPGPRLLAVPAGVAAGLVLEPVAALVGGAMFVDLTGNSSPTPFAGEDSLKKTLPQPLAPDATPRQVMEAFTTALKAGDQTSWNSLFADWFVLGGDDDLPLYRPYAPYPEGTRDEDWGSSRQLILEKILDVRIVWVGDPKWVMRKDVFPGAPGIEDVSVELELIGQFDGEYHAFIAAGLNHSWFLQRRNGGPWLISSRQPL